MKDNERNIGRVKSSVASAIKAQDLFDTAYGMSIAYKQRVVVTVKGTESSFDFFPFGSSSKSEETRDLPLQPNLMTRIRGRAQGEAWSTHKLPDGTVTKGLGKHSRNPKKR